MSVDVGEERTSVTRSGALPNAIEVSPNPFIPDAETSTKSMSNATWKELLGESWFGLPPTELTKKYHPSFRSLFSYVVRRQTDGGFIEPMKHTTRQQEWDSQAAICYLVNLDSTIPGLFQQLREREKGAKQIRNALKSSDIAEHFASSGELRTPLAIAEDQSLQLKRSIESFKVHPEYRHLEKEASQITQQISELNMNNVVDQELIDELKIALESEKPPTSQEILSLYEEAGVVLPTLVRKQLHDVKSFHEAIIENNPANQRTKHEQRGRPGTYRRTQDCVGIRKTTYISRNTQFIRGSRCGFTNVSSKATP